MLTVVDKPLIQYAVEEAIEAGCKEIIFVTSSNKKYPTKIILYRNFSN